MLAKRFKRKLYRLTVRKVALTGNNQPGSDVRRLLDTLPQPYLTRSGVRVQCAALASPLSPFMCPLHALRHVRQVQALATVTGAAIDDEANPDHHSTAQHNTSQQNTSQHNTSQHNTSQHNTSQCNTSQHSTSQHNTSQHSTSQHNTSQHSTSQHNTSQHNTSQYNTSQYSTKHPSNTFTTIIPTQHTNTERPHERLHFLTINYQQQKFRVFKFIPHLQGCVGSQ